MKRTFIVFIIFIVCAVSLVAKADDVPEVKLKSHSTARILSFLPLNSPAIYYVKRPVRGTVYTVLELGGMTAMGYGAYILSQVAADDTNHPIGNAARSVATAAGVGSAIIGLALWLPPWIHTVVKTDAYVDDCNQNILEDTKKTSLLPLIRDIGGREVYGLAFNYKF